MPRVLQRHLAGGRHCPGVLIVRSAASFSAIMQSLELIAYAGEPSEFADSISYIP